MEQNEKRTRRLSPFQKNRRLQGKYLSLLLIGTVFLFLVLGIVIKDRTFSESENRNLAQAPELSVQTLTDGSFLKDLSDYTADQFPARDFWMSLNLRFQQLLGQKEAGGVYLGDDHYLMQIPSAPNEVQLERNLQAISDFGQRHRDLNTVVSIVPNAVTIHSDKLPDNAPVRDQLADLQNIRSSLRNVTFRDVTENMTAHSTEELFYRTDHHWTSLGAYRAFEVIAPSLGIQAPSWDSYDRYVVSTTFEGTLSSKSGSHAVRDRVEICVPYSNIEYYVTYPENQNGICSMYHRPALDAKDHYTVFFGGNYSRVDITTSADTERNLLLFKDSYANCMVQYLYPYFDHIVMIDPRYYYDNAENVIRSEGITDVLFLYNLDTFQSDSSLADVLVTP